MGTINDHMIRKKGKDGALGGHLNDCKVSNHSTVFKAFEAADAASFAQDK